MTAARSTRLVTWPTTVPSYFSLANRRESRSGPPHEGASRARNAERRVARRPKRSRDRVPDAHRLFIGAGVFRTRPLHLLFRVGFIDRGAERARTRSTLGRARVL